MEERNVLTDGDQVLIARPYQEQLEEVSLRKNTIIHLPTGSGKTYIAIRLIKRFRNALQKPWGQGGKRTFFLVNTVPLVVQQKEKIEKLCPVSGVGAYSGDDGVDFWDKEKWDAELTKNQVVVMTTQILFDMLTHSYIKIENINLIIFDECHHAVDDHPMRMVMKHFEGCPIDKQPRVIGLTATLLNANVSKCKVEDALRGLETTFHATIATVNELGEVLNYSTNPFELVQYYRSLNPSAAAREAIMRLDELEAVIITVKLPYITNNDVKLNAWQRDISTDPKKIVKCVRNMIVAMKMFIEELGVYGGSLSILAYITLLERLKRKAATKQEELLYTITITHILEARMILLDSMQGDTGYEKIIKHSSDKVIQLLKILKEYHPQTIDNAVGVLLKVNKARQPLCAIIFTQQRFTAKVLYNLLKDVKQANPEEFDFIKLDFIVGCNMNPTKVTRENHFIKKTTETALLKFRNSELNCLISTSVIEEGVDIPQCLLVLKYDQPLEYRSYIQSKGRARNAQSSYVILVNEQNLKKFQNLYAAFQLTERTIQNILVGNTDNRSAPTEDDIQEDLYEQDDIPPYVTAHGGRLSSVSAISLLSRYCSTLPHDQFTTITPMWIEEKVSDPKSKLSQGLAQELHKRVISIFMPIACPIKEEIKGLPFLNTKTAKRSAALNACIKLHQVGELDAVTLLPKPYMTVNFDSEEVKTCFPNWPENDEDVGSKVPKAGRKARKRKYRLQFPTCLKAEPNQETYYLHVIKMSTNFDKPTEPRDIALYDFIQAEETYGFLTQKPLYELCSFPMFTKVGEVTTSVELNYALIKLDDKLFELIKQFHLFLFDQVLAIAKKFLVFEGKENCMFVVPVKSDNGYDIDWEVMVKHKSVPPMAVPTDKERQSLQVTVDNYKHCVVSPWYREIISPDRYIVSNVLEYMTPRSPFGSDSYETYQDYYTEKYNLDVIGDKHQPLLEVRNITSGMNCLLPRAATINSFTDKQRKVISAFQGDYKAKGFLEIFVAEFCIKYDYPGVLWFKAMILPSILHRTYMLLVAQELMIEVANHTKYGNPKLEKNWEPIQVNIPVVVQSLIAHVEEPAPINIVDRINCPMDEDAPVRPAVSMSDSLYQLQKKKIHQDYPWDEKMEPVDIERNLSSITVMDIECYDKFMSVPIESNRESVMPQIRANYAAISPAPVKYNDKLKVLQTKPTGKGPELRDVLAALTTIKSNDAFNLERAETLGDSFLKFAATLYLYHKFPKLNEGQLTNIKCRLISNRNLYYAGAKINLGGRMKVEHFAPTKDFLVPGFFVPEKVEQFITSKRLRPTFLIGMQFPLEEQLTGKLSQESWQTVVQRYTDCDGSLERELDGEALNAMQCYIHQQAVSDKSVADCVEALIGTYLSSGGVLGAVKFLQWMKIIPPQDNFESILANPQFIATGLSLKKTTLADVDFLLNSCRSDVEKILNYKFRDPCFLLEALSHASYIQNRLTRSYERLEFLGDAILDFLITTHIFENCRELKPGEMTDLRSSLVNNVTFAAYVVKLGLHKFMCSKLNPNLDKAIIAFVDHQQHRKHEIIEDVLYLIDEEDCKVAQYIEVPKVLSDIFESLVGAIYLDSGGDLQAVWSVVYRIMYKEIDAFSKSVPKQPVRVLYENIHACPIFGQVMAIDSAVSKVMIELTFTKNDKQLKVHGVGTNKSQAKRAAAKLCLKILSI